MAPRSKKIRAPSEIFFGYRKSRECSPKIFDFRASGIPVQERGDFRHALNRGCFAVNAQISSFSLILFPNA